MKPTLIDLTERLVPISDFSQGKAGKIFADVYENNTEYIVLKNNQPTAIVLSIKEYKIIRDKIENMEKLLEEVENIRLLQLAEERKHDQNSSFEEFVAREGYSMDKIKELSESVEIE
jgi:PHD/YefM family antitoxin component YafN of YafNO toxin-antitoxin module